MRVKLDENLPSSLVPALAALGHGADSVVDEGLAGRDDPSVWAAAQRDWRFFVTQDLDFSDIRRFRPGAHHGLLLVRLREPGRLALFERILGVFRTEDAASWERCHIVITERKIRIRRPPS